MTLNMDELIRGGTFCCSKAGLAEGTNANTLKTAAPNGAGTDFCIDGIMYHDVDADNQAMTALAAQAVLTTCIYLVTVNGSATPALTITKGTEQLTADLTAGTHTLAWPTPPADSCPIGAFKVACASTATFTSGTTDLSAANLTVVYYDLASVPTAPLTS